MYYLPEMFRNTNHYDFGKLGEEAIEDVHLPPWCHSPEEFVQIMRAALESDIVSAHLNEWIDLIFGYKQRGEEAVIANNVFYPITYQVRVCVTSNVDPGYRNHRKCRRSTSHCAASPPLWPCAKSALLHSASFTSGTEPANPFLQKSSLIPTRCRSISLLFP